MAELSYIVLCKYDDAKRTLQFDAENNLDAD